MKNLAAAYGIKRKQKKMAKGGAISASTESRPMPSTEGNDKPSVMQNNSKAPLSQDKWTDQPTVKQSMNRPKTQPIRHPKMVPSNAFSTRLRSEEDELQRLAGGGAIHPAQIDRPDAGWGAIISKADGGMIPEGSEDSHTEHPMDLEEDNDQMRPSESEVMANHFADGGEAYDQYGYPKDKSKNKPLYTYAQGGPVGDEAEEEHHASIAAAIMARKAKMMAEGGEVEIEENGEEQPNQYYRQNQAALKENYDSDMEDVSQPMDSNETADTAEADEENKLDKISKMRAKIAYKRMSR